MNEHDEQLERFREAVDRKNEKARAAAEGPHPQNPRGTPAEGYGPEQPPLHEPAYPPDERDPRAKAERKGKVTADKWNQ
jgi:hypothetical protein